MQENGTSNEDILIDEGETENMWDLDGEAESNTTALAPLNAYDAQVGPCLGDAVIVAWAATRALRT